MPMGRRKHGRRKVVGSKAASWKQPRYGGSNLRDALRVHGTLANVGWAELG